MQSFSLTDRKMAAFEQDVEHRAAMQPAEPWPASQSTAVDRARRVRDAERSFWKFDQLYFPPEMYGGGYAAPNRMHKAIVQLMQKPGVDVVIGPRLHGKTVTAKKVLAWLLLTERVRIGGTYSHTLPTASNILTDVAALILENPRIVEDFAPEFAENNSEQFKFRTSGRPRWRFAAAFSEGKSVRGFSRMFGRPDVILADDVETLNSPLGSDHSKERIKKVSEAHLSLSESGSFVWLGNNFDERCSTNLLREEQKACILNSHWRVHTFDAWDERKGEPMWLEKFGAISIEDLREACRAKDDADWSGNFRGRPRSPDGDIFPREHYREFDHLPDDARGVIYCDPNLARKSKGDRTAIVAYLYAPSTDQFYVADYVLKSFSGSNALLDTVLSMRQRFDLGVIFRLGFDGNVNQESVWSNNVKNWCVTREAPFPHVEYMRLNVDQHAKNLQSAWEESRVSFPPGTQATENGKMAINSVCTFAGKKANRPDDLPDALINAHELICATGYARPRRARQTTTFESIADPIRF